MVIFNSYVKLPEGSGELPFSESRVACEIHEIHRHLWPTNRRGVDIFPCNGLVLPLIKDIVKDVIPLGYPLYHLLTLSCEDEFSRWNELYNPTRSNKHISFLGETWASFAAKITLLFLLTITPCHLGICRKFLGCWRGLGAWIFGIHLLMDQSWVPYQ